MMHVGNRKHCHGGQQGCPCRCVSSTTMASAALERVRCSSRYKWLHVIAVKYGELSDVALDLSGACPCLDAGTRTAGCIVDDDHLNAEEVRAWGR